MNLIKTTVFRKSFFINPDIVMFRNWQGINIMDISAYLSDFKKNFTKMKMSQKNLR